MRLFYKQLEKYTFSCRAFSGESNHALNSLIKKSGPLLLADVEISIKHVLFFSRFRSVAFSTPGWTFAHFNKLKLNPFPVAFLFQQNSFSSYLLNVRYLLLIRVYIIVFCLNQQHYISECFFFLFTGQCLWPAPWFQVVYEISMRAKYRGKWPTLPTTTQIDTALRTTWTLSTDWAMRYRLTKSRIVQNASLSLEQGNNSWTINKVNVIFHTFFKGRNCKRIGSCVILHV